MRALIVGMSNPHGGGPSRALHPSIAGSAGANLFRMVREYAASMALEPFSEQEYLEAFARMNLVEQGDWSAEAGCTEKNRIICAARDHTVLLGTMVPSCLGLRDFQGRWYQRFEEYPLGLRVNYSVIPHPSGLNRVYNDPSYKMRTGKHLLDLAREPNF